VEQIMREKESCVKKNKKLINPVIEYAPKPYDFLLFYRYVHPVCCNFIYSDSGRRTKIDTYTYLEAPQLIDDYGFWFFFLILRIGGGP